VALRREEVWVNEKNEVIRYNLAYVDHLVCQVDNGRVLGYDNAHQYHERHWMGTAQRIDHTTFTETLEKFNAEVDHLRGKK
jgi:hypothetical protein